MGQNVADQFRRTSQAQTYHRERVQGSGDNSELAYRYAILSHRWEDEEEELTFDEVQSGRISTAKKGLYKLDKLREQADYDGIDWVWIDTCCIDKRSSAELQEAINSMFRYYEEASVCYVYLQDVQLHHPNNTNKQKQLDIETLTLFKQSEYFTRGWTLHELIAPMEVMFYDAEPRRVGNKTGLSKAIQAATNLPSQVLCGAKPLHEYPIAQRMSWAARRRMTRIEDRTYSLLGLFGVNMPLLYGEG